MKVCDAYENATDVSRGESPGPYGISGTRPTTVRPAGAEDDPRLVDL